jgi:hypothetical protein
MSNAPQSLEDRLAALEAEIARLRVSVARSEQNGTSLVAPVRIVDASGILLADIVSAGHDTAVRLYNRAGKPVALLGADGTQAGYLAVRNAEGQMMACIDIEMAGARLLLYDHSQRMGVGLFGGDSGDANGGGINIGASSGNLAATLWADSASGLLTVYSTESGETIATVPSGNCASGDEGSEP